MSGKELIRDFLGQMIQIKKEIDNYEDMKFQTQLRLDQINDELFNDKYSDFLFVIGECNEHITRYTNMIEALWLKIDSLGGVYSALDC